MKGVVARAIAADFHAVKAYHEAVGFIVTIHTPKAFPRQLSG